MLLLYNLYGIDFCNFLLGFCKEKKEKEQKASVRPQAWRKVTCFRPKQMGSRTFCLSLTLKGLTPASALTVEFYSGNICPLRCNLGHSSAHQLPVKLVFLGCVGLEPLSLKMWMKRACASTVEFTLCHSCKYSGFAQPLPDTCIDFTLKHGWCANQKHKSSHTKLYGRSDWLTVWGWQSAPSSFTPSAVMSTIFSGLVQIGYVA